MSAFDGSSFGEEHLVEKKTSGLAIGSLVCSLICCLPFTTIPGILLGIGAMMSISGNPAKKGKGLAITGIVLGVLFTAGQGIIYPKAYSYIQETIALVTDGPKDALTAGFANDFDGMRAAFYGDGSSTSDEEVRAFIDQLQTRYGGFVSSNMTDPQTQPTMGQQVVVFPYALTFENATVNAETQIIFSDPQKGGFINKLGYIKVLDSDLGDLEYPSAEVNNNENEDEGASDTPSESAPSESDSGD